MQLTSVPTADYTVIVVLLAAHYVHTADASEPEVVTATVFNHEPIAHTLQLATVPTAAADTAVVALIAAH